MARPKRTAPHVFGKIVTELRQKKGWSRYKLTAASGHPAAQLYSIEKGGNEPTINTLIWVAQALDMDPRDLFNIVYTALEEEKIKAEQCKEPEE